MNLYCGDCLRILEAIPSGSIDMVLVDLPYGTTACSWDSVIPLSYLWTHYNRVCKPAAAMVFTSSQPFTTSLISSNLENFRYCWYWNKIAITGFANAKRQPLRCIEEVVVFYRTLPLYNPQGLIRNPTTRRNSKSVGGESLRTDIQTSSNKGSLRTAGKEYTQEFTNYPKQLLEIPRDGNKIHPTQKPVALMEYLIKTYTKERETVLDNCMGSGTTGIACLNANRNFIGIEKDETYFKSAKNRLEEWEIDSCF